MREQGVYVVRIYRRNAEETVGVVESVESGEHLSFRSSEQLWIALQRLPSPRAQYQIIQQDEENPK